ncbi:MAG TPA: BatA domain-containing protein, partial [Candidatus Binataceae bacterium]|nr:BatA domain-containing protein [Candidatus Binataceae bacterium]
MGFLDPFKLLYALSLAALVAIYLRSRSRPTIEVSSLMLFEEVAAPIAKSRVLRLDLMFWLEAAALAALTLTLGGLYMRRGVPVSTAREHALIFDLGAGMGAVDERGQSRLAAAQRAADALVAAAPAGTHFSVIGYALEAATTRP